MKNNEETIVAIEKQNENLNDNTILLNIDQIIIDPEFSGEFDIDEKVFNRIIYSMQEKGFDKTEPLVVWLNNDVFVLIDGHTRRKAALELNIFEVPISIKNSKDRMEALSHTKSRQINRRNLSDKKLLKYVKNMPKKKEKDG